MNTSEFPRFKSHERLAWVTRFKIWERVQWPIKPWSMVIGNRIACAGIIVLPVIPLASGNCLGLHGPDGTAQAVQGQTTKAFAPLNPTWTSPTWDSPVGAGGGN